jgi:hypothetical protein
MLHLTLSEDLAVLYVSYAARFAFMAVSYVMLLAKGRGVNDFTWLLLKMQLMYTIHRTHMQFT